MNSFDGNNQTLRPFKTSEGTASRKIKTALIEAPLAYTDCGKSQ
jgi:hypothetical protein